MRGAFPDQAGRKAAAILKYRILLRQDIGPVQCMKQFISRLTLAVLCVFTVTSLPAQRPETHWAALNRDGGPRNRSVYSVAQDAAGFIWLGTEEGLFRFDGYSYLKWGRGQDVARYLPGLKVNKLVAVGDYIWFALDDKQLIRFNTVDFSYTCIFESGNDNIQDLIAAGDSLLLLATRHRVLWLDIHTGLIRKQYPFWGVNAVQRIVTDGSLLWIGTRPAGLGRINEEGKVVFTSTGGKHVPYPGYSVDAILLPDDSVVLYGGWDNGLHRYHKRTGKTEYSLLDGTGQLSYSGEEITGLCRVGPSEVWVGTRRSGIYSYNLETGRSERVGGKSFKGTRVHAIYVDRQGRRWVATDEGINLWDAGQNRIELHYLPVREEQERQVRVFSFASRGAKVLIGTGSAVYLDATGNGSLKRYPMNLQGQSLEARCMAWADEHTPVIGSNRSLHILDLRTGQIRSAIPFYKPPWGSSSFNPVNLLSSRFTQVVQSGNKLIATAMGHGLLEYDRASGNAFYGQVEAGGSSGYLLNSLYVDEAGPIWVACKENGLYTGLLHDWVTSHRTVYNEQGDSIGVTLRTHPCYRFRFRWYNDGKCGLQVNSINSFSPARRKGTFWVATQGGGAYHFDPWRKPEFVRVAEAAESPESMLEDSLGRIWMIEGGALLLYNTVQRTLTRFDQSYGLPETGIEPPLFRAENGWVYAAAKGAYIRFRPEQFPDSYTRPEVPLQYTGVSGPGISSGPVHVWERLKLHEEQGLFTIGFAALEYALSPAIRYRYYLDGFSDRWIDVGTLPEVTFARLPAGTYTLKVQAFSKDGRPLSSVAALPLTIVPYWWKTWWFRSLVLFFVLALVYVFYRYRIHQLVKMQRLRDRIARDLHDDIGSTLGAINIYTNAAKANLQKEDSQRTLRILDQIGEHAREMSNHMGDIIWAVHPGNDKLVRLTERIRMYANDLLRDSGIELHFSSGPDAMNRQLDMSARRNIYLIVKECLHNALKYAACSRISVRFSLEGPRLHIVVEDNGKGFDPESIEPFNGNGLRNMRSRAAEIGAELEIISASGRGCKVEIRV